jgi:xylulokinase
MFEVTPPPRHRAPRAGFLGIDLGTSSAKAVLTDASGTVLMRPSAGYPVDNPAPAWSESDPELWWAAVRTSVREVLASTGAVVEAIGLSGQMHGLVVTDDAGRPQRPAITWADSRAVAQLAAYRALPERALARLANPLAPGMAGPLLAWLAAEEPTVYADTRWAVQPKDWIRSRLTGLMQSEPSDASATLLFDVPGDQWDRETVEALGLDPAKLGRLTATAADELGLPPGIPVAAGAADSAAAVFGAGLTRHQAQITIGTGAQIIVPLGHDLPTVSLPAVTHVYRDATPQGWYEMAAVQSGGLVLSWVIQVLGASWAELYAAATTPARPDDPIFLPHLTGERTPYLDPTMRGAWTGLDVRHDRSSLLRAALEGVAFTLAEAMDHLTVPRGDRTPIRIAGGGSTDPGWQQMLADILEAPLQGVDAPDASGRGAALLAACAAGHLDAQSVAALTTPALSPAALPDSATAQLYAERRHTFAAVLRSLRHSNDSPPARAQRSDS